MTEPENKGFLAIIEKASSLENVNVDSLERMMKMQIEWENRQEGRAFQDAIARVQEKLSLIRIYKSKSVGYDVDKNDKSKGQKEAFKYAPIEEIDKHVRPLLVAEGITPSYTSDFIGNGLYNITCKLSKGLQHISCTIPLPIDSSGGKNNVQGMGSTFSYGKRYALCAALNILTVGEDNDGQGAPITEEQAAEIKLGLKETGLDVVKFLKNMKVESVDEIPTKDFARAKNAIDAKRYQMLQKQKGDKQ